ncbi:MAG: hypothetical protein WA624_01225, partial [Methylocella sp.]
MVEVPAGTGAVSSNEIPLGVAPKLDRSSSQVPGASMQHKAVRLGNIEPARLTLVKQSILPLVSVLVLAVCVVIGRQDLSLQFSGLALLTFLICLLIFTPLDLRTPERVAGRTRRVAARILLEWACVAAILVFVTASFQLHIFPRQLMIGWFLATPVALLIVDSLGTSIARRLAIDLSMAQRYIIIGANDVGLELARRIAQLQSGGEFLGYFDYRNAARLCVP